MRISLLLAFSFAVVPAAQATYKWVDEKGVTHYSEHPPEGKATKMEVKPAAGAPSAAERPDRWKDRELEFRERQAGREREYQREKAKAEKAAAQRKVLCGRARTQLDVMQHIGGVYRLNEKDERIYLDPNDRLRETERWKKVAKENCD